MLPKGLFSLALVTICVTFTSVQGHTIIKRSDNASVGENDVNPATMNMAAETLIEPDYQYGETVSDFQTYIQNYSLFKEENSTRNWRKGMRFTEALTYMFNNSKLTDCAFIVGPDGKTERIEAHAVILAAVSPVFEAALDGSNTLFRIKDWKPSDFKTLLNFIYSGDLCFKDFDEACTLLKLASSIGLGAAHEAARAYISNYMYPNKLWHAYQCAKEASDENLLEVANKFISGSTSAALLDPKFYSLTRDDITKLVMRDDLAIESEVEIFEALTRWALKKIASKGLKTTPEQIRKTLGPVVVKNIRFLTMTSAEFSKINLNARILDFEEGLAVFLYMNSPQGGVDLPSTLSTNKEKRKLNDTTKTFFSTSLNNQNCAKSTEGQDYYDYFTTTAMPTNDQYKLIGIQIPKSMEGRNRCLGKEHFDVLILDSSNKIVSQFTYNQVPPCAVTRFIHRNRYGIQRVMNDDNLINVKFTSPVSIPRVNSEAERYKIKIVFHDTKEYPRWVESSDFNTTSVSFDYHEHFMGSYHNYRMMYKPSFVYAIIF